MNDPRAKHEVCFLELLELYELVEETWLIYLVKNTNSKVRCQINWSLLNNWFTLGTFEVDTLVNIDSQIFGAV